VYRHVSNSKQETNIIKSFENMTKLICLGVIITIKFCFREEMNTLNVGNDSVLYEKQNALCEDHIRSSSVTQYRRLNRLSDSHAV
jgi:hypothetical protein